MDMKFHGMIGVCAGVLAGVSLSSSALATPHQLPFTYGYATLGEGESEVEAITDMNMQRVYADPEGQGDDGDERSGAQQPRGIEHPVRRRALDVDHIRGARDRRRRVGLAPGRGPGLAADLAPGRQVRQVGQAQAVPGAGHRDGGAGRVAGGAAADGATRAGRPPP